MSTSDNALLNGLGGAAGFGENVLGRNDDSSTEFIDFTSIFASGLNFFGTVYYGFYINNNGNITFNGEYFADEKAFQVLCRLKTIPDEEPRSLVPHGLEHIISDSGDEHLARIACAELVDMKNDPSEQVRVAVDDSLKSLTNQGIKCD